MISLYQHDILIKVKQIFLSEMKCSSEKQQKNKNVIFHLLVANF